MIKRYEIAALDRRAMLPPGASFKRWWLVLLLFAFVCHGGASSTVAFEIDAGDPKPDESQYSQESRVNFPPEYVYSVLFFDTENRAGIQSSFRSPVFSCRYGKEDGSVVEAANQLSPGAVAPNFGLPFWWEFKTPWNGRVMGWTTTRRYFDQINYCIPVPGSEAGMTLDYEGNFAAIATIGLAASLVDRLNTPSPLVYDYLSYSGKTSILTAVYLPGNLISESVGIESHPFSATDLSQVRSGVLWGDYDRYPPYSNEARFSHTVPFGPVLLAMTFDGSTTAMVETYVFGYLHTEINAPFAPLPGSSIPTATEVLQIPDPPDWITDVFYEAALLGDSVDLTTDVDTYCDRNGDGIIDVADQFAFHVLEGERGAAPRLLRNP